MQQKTRYFSLSVIFVGISIIIIPEKYSEIYELMLINYLFDLILGAFCCSEGCQEHIWFITKTSLGDIIGWNNVSRYFPTHGNSLICSCLLSLRELHHRFISCMLSQASSKIPPKSIGHLRIFQIFSLTWLLLDCIHEVSEMSQGRNCTFLLRPTLG